MSALKIFPQLYVGLRSQNPGIDLGFAAPYENNAASRKRIETITSWAKDYSTKKARHIIVDNKPLGGFKVTDDIKRIYWGGGNVVWRVEDPRGFELEISSANLMALLKTTTFEKGLIAGDCVWARDGATNVLLHVDSEPYKESLKNYSTSAEKVATGLQPGTKVMLKTGEEAYFLGRMHVSYIETEYTPKDHRLRHSPEWNVRIPITIEGAPHLVTGEVSKHHLVQPVLVDVIYFKDQSTLRLYSKAKLVSTGDVELTPAEIKKALTQEITWAASGTYTREGEHFGSGRRKLVVVPATAQDVQRLRHKADYNRHPVEQLNYNYDRFPRLVYVEGDRLFDLHMPVTQVGSGHSWERLPVKVMGSALLPCTLTDEQLITLYPKHDALPGGTGGGVYIPRFTSNEQRNYWIDTALAAGKIKKITIGAAE